MKFYNSLGPNPRLVRMFFAEKGLDLPECVEIDIMAGANRQAAYTDVNPAGQLPALQLDDGRVIAETVAICCFAEESHPASPCLGADPAERAEALMWTLRVMHSVTEPLASGFRFAEGLAMFKDRMHVIPHAADDFKQIASEGLEKLDAHLADREWICGDRLTLADIVLYCFLDFGTGVGQPRDPALKNVDAWFERINARPSADASLHPVAKAGGMRA